MIKKRNEKELVYSIVTSLVDILDDKNDFVITTELPAAYRKIDITIALLPLSWDDNKIQPFVSKLRPLTLKHLMVLEKIIHLGRSSIEVLSEKLHIDSSTLDSEYINLFAEQELIREFDSAQYEISDWIEMLPIHVTCIEAKMKKWRDALKQAIYNIKFSNQSYIALPKSSITNYEAITHMLHETGVGLIVVDQEDLAYVKIPAKDNSSPYYIDRGLQKLRIFRDLTLKNRDYIHIQYI